MIFGDPMPHFKNLQADTKYSLSKGFEFNVI